LGREDPRDCGDRRTKSEIFRSPEAVDPAHAKSHTPIIALSAAEASCNTGTARTSWAGAAAELVDVVGALVVPEFVPVPVITGAFVTELPTLLVTLPAALVAPLARDVASLTIELAREVASVDAVPRAEVASVKAEPATEVMSVAAVPKADVASVKTDPAREVASERIELIWRASCAAGWGLANAAGATAPARATSIMEVRIMIRVIFLR